VCADQTGLRVANGQWNAGQPGRANIYSCAVNCDSNRKDSRETFSRDTAILYSYILLFAAPVSSLFRFSFRLPYLLHTCLSVYLPTCLTHPSIHLSIYPSIHPSVHPSPICPNIRPSVSLLPPSAGLSICVHNCPPIYLSVSLYILLFLSSFVLFLPYFFLLCCIFLLHSILSVSFPLCLILLHSLVFSLFKFYTIFFYDYFPFYAFLILYFFSRITIKSVIDMHCGRVRLVYPKFRVYMFKVLPS